MLPFGLRSALKIFTTVADALEWVARQRGVPEIDHYLDDFVTLGPHATADCQKNLDIIIQTCMDLGIPLALEKLEGPTTCLTFLGIEINTLDAYYTPAVNPADFTLTPAKQKLLILDINPSLGPLSILNVALQN